MKIRTKKKDCAEVLALPPFPHRDPVRQSALLRRLVKMLSAGELKQVRFSHSYADAEDARAARCRALMTDDTPCLFLMNHSCFTDLQIAGTLLSKKPYHIVCTVDGFVGKDWLLRRLGCIPAKKFTSDLTMVRDMVHVTRELKESVLMYPEASYTFDGTATPLPESLGKFLRLLGVPVVMIRTSGAFLRDPLYNGLQKRDVTVTAQIRLLFTPEEIRGMKAGELNARLREAFTFDGFREQQEAHVRVAEPFRADGLERVLYRCPRCGAEGRMLGRGTALTCRACGAGWTLSELGTLDSDGGAGAAAAGFTHVPDWYAWERACVRREIEDGTYRMELPVRIMALVNTDCVYEIGEGTLTHSPEGFRLRGCGGKLDFTQSPGASYSLYADYFWYEIGDMICIGDTKAQFYCFPQLPDGEAAIVAKARLAAEEMYKMA